MENRQYQCSMTPFICSIVPFVFFGLIWFHTPFLIWFRARFLPGEPVFYLFLFPPVALSMGIYSVISGIAKMRVPEARGKTLVVAAIVLGILDIVGGLGFLLFLLFVLIPDLVTGV